MRTVVDRIARRIIVIAVLDGLIAHYLVGSALVPIDGHTVESGPWSLALDGARLFKRRQLLLARAT